MVDQISQPRSNHAEQQALRPIRSLAIAYTQLGVQHSLGTDISSSLQLGTEFPEPRKVVVPALDGDMDQGHIIQALTPKDMTPEQLKMKVHTVTQQVAGRPLRLWDVVYRPSEPEDEAQLLVFLAAKRNLRQLDPEETQKQGTAQYTTYIVVVTTGFTNTAPGHVPKNQHQQQAAAAAAAPAADADVGAGGADHQPTPHSSTVRIVLEPESHLSGHTTEQRVLRVLKEFTQETIMEQLAANRAAKAAAAAAAVGGSGSSSSGVAVVPKDGAAAAALVAQQAKGPSQEQLEGMRMEQMGYPGYTVAELEVVLGESEALRLMEVARVLPLGNPSGPLVIMKTVNPVMEMLRATPRVTVETSSCRLHLFPSRGAPPQRYSVQIEHPLIHTLGGPEDSKAAAALDFITRCADAAAAAQQDCTPMAVQFGAQAAQPSITFASAGSKGKAAADLSPIEAQRCMYVVQGRGQPVLAEQVRMELSTRGGNQLLLSFDNAHSAAWLLAAAAKGIVWKGQQVRARLARQKLSKETGQWVGSMDPNLEWLLPGVTNTLQTAQLVALHTDKEYDPINASHPSSWLLALKNAVLFLYPPPAETPPTPPKQGLGGSADLLTLLGSIADMDQGQLQADAAAEVAAAAAAGVPIPGGAVGAALGQGSKEPAPAPVPPAGGLQLHKGSRVAAGTKQRDRWQQREEQQQQRGKGSQQQQQSAAAPPGAHAQPQPQGQQGLATDTTQQLSLLPAEGTRPATTDQQPPDRMAIDKTGLPRAASDKLEGPSKKVGTRDPGWGTFDVRCPTTQHSSKHANCMLHQCRISNDTNATQHACTHACAADAEHAACVHFSKPGRYMQQREFPVLITHITHTCRRAGTKVALPQPPEGMLDQEQGAGGGTSPGLGGAKPSLTHPWGEQRDVSEESQQRGVSQRVGQAVSQGESRGVNQSVSRDMNLGVSPAVSPIVGLGASQPAREQNDSVKNQPPTNHYQDSFRLVAVPVELDSNTLAQTSWDRSHREMQHQQGGTQPARRRTQAMVANAQPIRPVTIPHDMFFERQHATKCWVHATNNALQRTTLDAARMYAALQNTIQTTGNHLPGGGNLAASLVGSSPDGPFSILAVNQYLYRYSQLPVVCQLTSAVMYTKPPPGSSTCRRILLRCNMHTEQWRRSCPGNNKARGK
jgi:hypothetical protein